MSIEKKKEQELIGAVLQLFMQLGIKSLTMDEIARQLGISKKTLYKYVTDKKDLVSKAMQCAIDEEQCVLCDLNAQEGNAMDKILAINKMVSEKLQSIQPAVIFDLKKYYPEAWEIMENHKREFIFNQVIENLTEGIEEGLYRENLNPEITARIYITLINSIFDSHLFERNIYSFQKIHTEVVRYHLRGIASEKGIKYIQSVFTNKQAII